MSTLLLDLRPPLRDTPLVTVEHPAGVAEAGGYRVEMERRTVNNRVSHAARFTDPDGSVIDVCWRSGAKAHTPKAMLADLTSEQLGRVYNKMSASVEADMAHRLQVVMQTATDLIEPVQAGEVSPTHGWLALMRASLVLNEAEVDAYNKPLTGDYRFPLKTIALLRDSDIPPEAAPGFVNLMGVYRRDSEFAAYGPFARNGWSGTEFDQFGVICSGAPTRRSNLWKPPPKKWAVIPYEHAVLARKANMEPAEARRLIDSGEWDSAAVETLVALLGAR